MLCYGFGLKMAIFKLFFYSIQAQKMSLTIFQNKKTPFQAIKKRSSNSRKIDIFPWNWSMEFYCSKNGKFSHFFQAIQHRKMSFTIFQNEKTPFQAIKTGSSKTRKNVSFSTFLTSFLYSLERYFFVLEYRKRHFPGLYCQKKQLEKWPFLDQSFGLTPLEKKSIFRLFELHVFWPRKPFFRSRIS